MTMLIRISMFLVPFLFVACSGDDSPTDTTPPDVRGLYIVNEGNFQRGNASLSYFIPDSGKVYSDIFQSVNGTKLGDTGNSITIYNGKAYIVVNGSNKVEVIDIRTYKLLKTIQCPPGASPRHIAFGPNAKGYISNLNTNDVSIYDDLSNALNGSYPVGQNPEQLLVANDYLFVTNSGFGNGNTVSVISTRTGMVVKTLRVGDNPTAILPIAQNTALVLCTGAYNDWQDPTDDTPGKLFIINTSSLTVKDSIQLGGHPQRLAFDELNNNAYTVQSDGIQRINLTIKSITILIRGSFYSVLFDQKTKSLFVTNPLDYVQPGLLEVYDLGGAKKGSYTVGIIPGSMAFAW